jgi:cystathionine beta-synthase
LKAARSLPASAVMVVLLPDGGRGYLGKIFNEKWMQSYGFTQVSDEKTVADVLSRKTGDIPDLVHVHPIDTVRDAVKIMAEYDISQLPVLTAEPPVVMGEIAGAIDEKALLDDIFTGKARMTDSIAEFIGQPLGLIGMHESVTAARTALAEADALMVTNDGKPVGVLTRQDLLTFLTA